ncbi:hypothetical protein [Gordonia aurantiaca]|uniref:hypothetical protein n=1 Tax=Gordonia sp. B21 TaxID=3151852 RepID=UPI0032656E9C
MTLLEDLMSACAAARVREAANLDVLRAADEERRTVPQARRGHGLAAEVGLAGKASPQRVGRCLGFARASAYEMPHTMAAPLTDATLTSEGETFALQLLSSA